MVANGPLAGNGQLNVRTLATAAISIISACQGVIEACLFGSLASGRDDQYSDVDMMICLVEPSEQAPCVAGILVNEFPLLCHRPFEDQVLPSGRFWLIGYPVFAKIDLSFHSEKSYANRIAELERESVPYRLTSGYPRRRPGPAKPFRWSWTEAQLRLGDEIHRLERSYKAFRRTGADQSRVRNELYSLEGLTRALKPACPEESAAGLLGAQYHAEVASGLSSAAPSVRWP